MTGADEFRLLVLRGVEGRREFVLKGDVLEVGRPETGWNPAIPVPAEGVLAHHATLRREGAGYRLDPAPGAAVLVNRREFSGGPLHDGDIITLGAARFQFWAGGLARAEVTGGGGVEGAPARGPARPRALVLLLIFAGVVLLLVLIRSASLGPRR